jgi:hypothetical protein
MSKFIELTSFDGYRADEKILIPVDKIQLIKPSSRGGTTYVWIDGMKHEIHVLESKETIHRLIQYA